jgi:hypothetical protein
MDGLMEGWMDGWMGGWMSGQRVLFHLEVCARGMNTQHFTTPSNIPFVYHENTRKKVLSTSSVSGAHSIHCVEAI